MTLSILFFQRVFFKGLVFCQSPPLSGIYCIGSSAVLPQCAVFVIGFLFFNTISCIAKPNSLLLGNAKLVTNRYGYLTDCMRSLVSPILPPNGARPSIWRSPLGPVSSCVGSRSPSRFLFLKAMHNFYSVFFLSVIFPFPLVFFFFFPLVYYEFF